MYIYIHTHLDVIILRPQVVHKLMVSQPDVVFIDVRSPSEFSMGHVSHSFVVACKEIQ